MRASSADLKNEVFICLKKNCPGMRQEEITFLLSNIYNLKYRCKCSFCGKSHSAYNGTGPGSFNVLSIDIGFILRKILKYIPWDVWIQRTAVPFHDWMSAWGRSSGVTFKELNRVFRDLVELDINFYYKKKLKKCGFFRKMFWSTLYKLLLSRVDEICEYFVSSAQTEEIYNNMSCRSADCDS